MALERNTTLEEELSATKEEVSIISVGGKFFHFKGVYETGRDDEIDGLKGR